MIRRIFPHPYLSALLVLIWMLLVNRFAWGSLVFAVIISVAIPALTEPYWPDRARLRNPGKILAYIGLVIWDIIMANVQVAMIVLFKPNRKLQPAWITIPLDLRSPEAITVLASTITLTPGTVSADLSQDGHALLVHCLHAPDPESVIEEIKSRYEARLTEIFE
ncbi:Na+/H+ antiporter subunit E [Paracoccus saliphilus]|uniref:Multisubunit potassium/proton antiporter, PhaE subunit n=1 Tax=Paracoccus saliphilus TaxID=405559 RepID=A0AA46A6Q5_9RHOB|nr:Na+/H+ antiporter subunit E [Paracoccus saliphilus]WCR04431.1 Na+/H+ antiporter subunit E [Paracoccus saliphilus]SIT01457.1 multisubunit potassium/proton antiporter, PhaE subunit [Paracoccus saliphilus]